MTALSSPIPAVSGAVSALEAARTLLPQRLEAVARALPLAAREIEADPEDVHRLRVATRRAAAAVKLFRDLLPRRPARWFRKTLREIRHAADEARDQDVLRDRLQGRGDAPGSRRILERGRAQRRQAQAPICEVQRRFADSGLLESKGDELLAGLRASGDGSGDGAAAFDAWASAALRGFVRRFRKVSRPKRADAARLHQFRIRSKELRYALELLEPAFAGELHARVLKSVEKLQDRLGTVHDHAAAAEQFGAWLDQARDDEARDDEEREYLEANRRAELEACEERAGEFHAWWTSRRRRKLLKRLSRLGESSHELRSC